MRVLPREVARAATDKLFAETFNPRPLRILKERTSNLNSHYTGSARILPHIGVAFAEAMAGMIK